MKRLIVAQSSDEDADRTAFLTITLFNLIKRRFVHR